MNHFIVLFTFLCLLQSCNEGINYFEQLDQIPDLCICDSAAQSCSYIEDSVKTGYSTSIPFRLQSSSQTSITWNSSKGYDLSVDHNQLVFTGELSGDYLIKIKVTDVYRKAGMDTVQLTVFYNLPPVASLSYSVNKLGDSYYLQLDGSASYDGDRRFGGRIIEYYFSINQFSYLQNSPVLDYSVNAGETYTVSIRVEDNDSTWSAELIQYISI